MKRHLRRALSLLCVLTLCLSLLPTTALAAGDWGPGGHGWNKDTAIIYLKGDNGPSARQKVTVEIGGENLGQAIVLSDGVIFVDHYVSVEGDFHEGQNVTVTYTTKYGNTYTGDTQLEEAGWFSDYDYTATIGHWERSSPGGQDTSYGEVTFDVFYLIGENNYYPDPLYANGAAGDYGPGRNDTPMCQVTVDIDELIEKLKETYHKDNVVIHDYEGDGYGTWAITPQTCGVTNPDDYDEWWNIVLECIDQDSKAALEATGLADQFVGYVLKNQENGGDYHLDGKLTVTPPVYTVELYLNGDYVGGIVKSDDQATFAEVRNAYEDYINDAIPGQSVSFDWGSLTFTAGNDTYQITEGTHNPNQNSTVASGASQDVSYSERIEDLSYLAQFYLSYEKTTPIYSNSEVTIQVVVDGDESSPKKGAAVDTYIGVTANEDNGDRYSDGTITFEYQSYNCADIDSITAEDGYVIEAIQADLVYGGNGSSGITADGDGYSLDNVQGSSTVTVYVRTTYTAQFHGVDENQTVIETVSGLVAGTTELTDNSSGRPTNPDGPEYAIPENANENQNGKADNDGMQPEETITMVVSDLQTTVTMPELPTVDDNHTASGWWLNDSTCADTVDYTAGQVYTVAAKDADNNNIIHFYSQSTVDTGSYTVVYEFLDENGEEDATVTTDDNGWVEGTTFPSGGSANVGEEVSVNPSNTVTRTENDKYVLVSTNHSCTITKDGPNTITVTYALDNWKDDKGGDDETGGDGTPDYQQALIKYVSAGNGSVSPTVQVETLTADGDGTYSGSVTASSKATASSGYAFDYWTEPDGTTSWNATLSDTFTAQGGKTYTYTAYFDTDANGDGIPDKYQATVTYKIVGGTWSDGSIEISQVYNFKKFDKDTQTWETVTPAPTLTNIPDVNDVIPNADYIKEGSWDKTPTIGSPLTAGETYTYTYTLKATVPSLSVNKTVNPTSGVSIGDTLTYTITVTNNGNQTLTNVTVTDTMWGDKVTSITVGGSTVPVSAAGYTIGNLPVGETVTITYTYTVTADDLGKTIKNTVIAQTGEDGPDDSDTTETKVEEGELTVIIQPADITIYTGGKPYGGITDASGDIIKEASGLPEPGYHLELSADVMAWLNEKTGAYGPRDLEDYLTFIYEDDVNGREWKLTYMGIYDTNPTRYVYSMSPVDPTNPEVRIVYTDSANVDRFDDDIDMSETAVSAKYTMNIYPGEVDQQNIKAQFEVDGEKIEATVDIQPGTLTIRSTTDEEYVNEIAADETGVVRNAITAVADGVTYYVNDSEVEVAADRVSLLVDEVSNNAGFNWEMAQDAMDHAIDNTSWNRWSDLSYDMAYLDLVDTLNGHAVVTMGEGDSLTIYWPMPNDANRRGDFHVVHYHTMNRESIENDLDDADKEILTGEAVRIDGQWYVAFDTDSFSPFVLVYEAEDDDDDRPRPPRPDDDDDDEDDVEEPDETPLDDGLNREDHYAYLAGYTDGTIRPEGNITRAEVATIFFRLMTDEYREDCWSQHSGFTDVSSASWYNNAVSTTAQAGWIAGYEDGSFRPDAYITRAEFATIAARFLSEDYAGGHRFNDIQGHWAAEYIDRAAAAGWIGGYEDGTFRPNAYITRAEVATLVNRMLDRAPDVGHLLPDMVRWPDNPETAWYYADIQEATNSHDYTWAGTARFEVWTELLPNRDWAALEEIWSQANDAPGGEVMD